MAEPIARIGNFIHVYDFRVKPGMGDEFIRRFDEFDHSGANPMHGSPAQVREGVLCQDENDPDHFYLIGEWNDKETHRQLLQQLRALEPSFHELIEGGKLVPIYADVVA
ncbi:MAG TPA: antibiotic biosynthesis monooxygenase [Dehalococcoidia bacterium]|nr:antibiotic biosynthesis monooxygenase [Dehalococcoidia bacterium]